MNLAEKVFQLRKKNGWSQEELAEKCSVSRQSVSKWEGGASIPDLDKILLMSQLFGVTTDYLLKDDLVEEEHIQGDESVSGLRRITLEEANEFMQLRRNASTKTGIAVVLCILSPTFLILLGAMSEIPQYSITEEAASGIGLIALFVLVAIAVLIFIITGNTLKPYEFLERENVELEYGVSGVVNERMKAYQPTYNWKLAVGVVLCIFSVIPLFVAMIMKASDFSYVIAIDALLVIVAAGTFLLVSSGMIKGSFDQLLQEGDYTVEDKNAGKMVEKIAGAYWSIVTAVYLGVSFYTMEWHRSWIIWPVAAVLFGAIAAICNVVQKSKK